MDVLLAKAGPIRNCGNDCENIFRKKKEKGIVQMLLWPEKRGVRTYERNNSADTQPMVEHQDDEIHLQPVEKTHTGAGGCLRGGCDPVGGLSGAGSGRDLQTHGLSIREEPILDQFWNLRFRKKIEEMEQVKRRARELVKCLENKSCQKQLRELEV
ncbi:hypothetical protein HGM15179_010336 [Zosterops borbonicus]|uniref:Uncharacterized protein n=1 Tax=Zosterops borbonicus TaxID=364589 RepID=A0A8K1GFC6_9PASS|nr:hypothetical protein HGM15179_010336 [Zosterops borbonicus]